MMFGFSGPLNEQWLDEKRYTNTIRYGATESVLLGKAFLSLLDVYSWRRLSVIFDSQKGDRRGLNIRTQQECMPILGLLRQRAADFHFLQIDVDSTDPKANLSQALLAAKAHSRSKTHFLLMNTWYRICQSMGYHFSHITLHKCPPLPTFPGKHLVIKVVSSLD